MGPTGMPSTFLPMPRRYARNFGLTNRMFQCELLPLSNRAQGIDMQARKTNKRSIAATVSSEIPPKRRRRKGEGATRFYYKGNRLKQLRAFCMSAKLGTFSRAAEALPARG